VEKMKAKIFKSFKKNPELLIRKNNQLLIKKFPKVKKTTLSIYKCEFLKNNPSFRAEDTKQPEGKSPAMNCNTSERHLQGEDRTKNSFPNERNTPDRQEKDSIDMLRWFTENKCRLEKLIINNQNISTIPGFKKSGKTKMFGWRIDQELTKQFIEKCKTSGLTQTQGIHTAINDFLNKYSEV
jgi:hypothetical protein